MREIVCIVEGHGEVQAAPILIRRIAEYLGVVEPIKLFPYRGKRQKLVKSGEIERVVSLMANKVGPRGGILVLLDADDDCPATLGAELRERARAVRADRQIAVVLACREYESWFVAAAASLQGRRGLPTVFVSPDSPDRHGKGFLESLMPDGYSETTDQPALSACMDIDAARMSRSFDKLVRDIAWLLDVGRD